MDMAITRMKERTRNMVSQTRRSVLKTLTGLPILALLDPVSRALPAEDEAAASPDSARLNVLFHGVFVYMFDPADSKFITAYAPAVGDHTYWAGNWQQEDENDLNQKSCELKGDFIGQGVAPNPKEENYPVIKCTNPLVTSKAVCQIRMPLPQKIVGLRRINRGIKPLLTGEYAPSALKHLPLTYAFVYKYDPSKGARPVLTNTAWKAPRRPGTVNLHIRAESQVAPMENGFDAIRDFLGYDDSEINIAPEYANCVIGPDLIPRVRGIKPQEEYSLAEMYPNHPVHLPGYPQTCDKKEGILLAPANCSGIHGILKGNAAT